MKQDALSWTYRDNVPGAAPAAPSQLEVSDLTRDQVELSWQDNADDEDGYAIYRKSGSETGFSFLEALPANSTSFLDGGLIANTEQEYRVEAYNHEGYSPQTQIAVATLLGAPLNLAAIPSTPFNGQVIVKWDAVGGGATYNLYRSTTSGDQGALPYQTGLTGTNFTDTSVTNGVTYFYQMTSVSGAVESQRSLEASTVHAGLIGSYFPFNALAPDDQAIFKRTDVAGPTVDGVVLNPGSTVFDIGGAPELFGYSVRWEGLFTPLTSETYTFFPDDFGDRITLWVNGQRIDQTDNSVVPIALQAGVSYPIQIDYAGSNGPAALEFETNSVPRQVVPLNLLSDIVALPAAPINLHVTSLEGMTATLAWSAASANSTTYTIEQSIDDVNFSTAAVTSGPDSSGATTGALAPLTKYYFRVIAQNVAGEAASESISITTPAIANGGAPVARYAFNEGSGTTVEDINVVGPHNNGLLAGEPPPQWIGSGDAGDPGALAFPGDNFQVDGSRVQVEGNLGMLLGGTATLTAWIKTSQSGVFPTPSQAPAITGGTTDFTGSTDNDQSFWGWLASDGRIGISSGGGTFIQSANPINDDTWHLVAFTRDADTGDLQVYVDGQLSGLGVGPTGIRHKSFQSIGMLTYTDPGFFEAGIGNHLNAALRDVRIYDRVVAEAEVADLWNAPPTVADVPVVPTSIARQLQSTVNTLAGAGGTFAASYLATTTGQVNAFLDALDDLFVSTSVPEIQITLNLGGNSFSGLNVVVPDNMVLEIENGTLEGASPSLSLQSGELVLTNSTLTNSTDAPTIRVLGGSLTLRNTTVLESDQHTQAAIEVLGGTVDLGTASDPGNNTINVRGAGTVVGGSAAPVIDPDAGNVLEQNGQTATPVRFLQGLSWVDFNNDGNVDFGEQGLEGVTMTLSGSDLLGQAINLTTQTDASGIYTFPMLWPGTYSISKGATPAGYLDGKDMLGTLGGSNAVANRFSNIPVGTQLDGLAYNFAQRPAPGSGITKDQSAGIGFWANKKGQALIGTFSNIGSWLAATLPHTFGAGAGTSNLAGKTPQAVAAAYLQRFVLHDKLDAQVMATALSVYATRTSLGGATATGYGFNVSQYGLGNATFNVGGSGAAFGVANGSTLTVMQILQGWDQVADPNDWALRHLAKDVFGNINGG